MLGINIKRIGHVGFLVSDFEQSYKFYTDVIGCALTNRRKNPDGNRLDIFTDGMKVPNGEQFPREEYAEAMKAYSHG